MSARLSGAKRGRKTHGGADMGLDLDSSLFSEMDIASTTVGAMSFSGRLVEAREVSQKNTQSIAKDGPGA